MLFGFITWFVMAALNEKGYSITCYDCVWAPGPLNSSCLGPNINSSNLVECGSNVTACSVISAVESNSQKVVLLRRSCASRNDTCISIPSFGQQCFSNCFTDACNIWNTNQVNTVPEQTRSCYVCTSNLTDYNPSCVYLNKNSSYLKQCSPYEKYCSFIKIVVSGKLSHFSRSCSTVNPTLYTLSHDNHSCALSCDTDFCNSFSNCTLPRQSDKDLCQKEISEKQNISLGNITKGAGRCFVCNSLQWPECAQENLPSKFVQTCPEGKYYCSKVVDKLKGGFVLVSRNCSSKNLNYFSYVDSHQVCATSCATDLCNAEELVISSSTPVSATQTSLPVSTEHSNTTHSTTTSRSLNTTQANTTVKAATSKPYNTEIVRTTTEITTSVSSLFEVTSTKVTSTSSGTINMISCYFVMYFCAYLLLYLTFLL